MKRKEIFWYRGLILTFSANGATLLGSHLSGNLMEKIRYSSKFQDMHLNNQSTWDTLDRCGPLAIQHEQLIYENYFSSSRSWKWWLGATVLTYHLFYPKRIDFRNGQISGGSRNQKKKNSARNPKKISLSYVWVLSVGERGFSRRGQIEMSHWPGNAETVDGPWHGLCHGLC